MLQEVIYSYSQFFSWDAMWGVISTPSNWGIILSLVVLEGLLSSDNALVLATLVSNLGTQRERKLALFAGIWGAYFFRFLVIGFGIYLIHFWWIKVLGALYLLWMSAKYFFFSGDEEGETKPGSTSFWMTVLQVELMDIAFSIDSISAAFGVSEKVWVLFLGAIIGILAMRGVAQIFVKLLERFSEFETTAYVLIGIIGLKMMASVFGYRLSDWTFFSCLVIVFLGTFAVHYLRSKISSDPNSPK
ncbi:MAG: TerC family protein [Bacillota bacterium]|nr:TerC family protein [Bacillota bacterium]